MIEGRTRVMYFLFLVLQFSRGWPVRNALKGSVSLKVHGGRCSAQWNPEKGGVFTNLHVKGLCRSNWILFVAVDCDFVRFLRAKMYAKLVRQEHGYRQQTSWWLIHMVDFGSVPPPFLGTDLPLIFQPTSLYHWND